MNVFELARLRLLDLQARYLELLTPYQRNVTGGVPRDRLDEPRAARRVPPDRPAMKSTTAPVTEDIVIREWKRPDGLSVRLILHIDGDVSPEVRQLVDELVATLHGQAR